jgi:secondary thiamine-phosphate synthase enzyme
MLRDIFAVETAAPAPAVRHDLIRLHTQECLQFIDLTDDVIHLIEESGIRSGFVNIQTRHTTTAILVNENEPLLLEDMKRTLERLAPRYELYQHDDFSIRTANMTPDEAPNGHAHCKALFLRTSEILNLADGRLQLGQWQRIFLIELDRARPRAVSVMVFGQ